MVLVLQKLSPKLLKMLKTESVSYFTEPYLICRLTICPGLAFAVLVILGKVLADLCVWPFFFTFSYEVMHLSADLWRLRWHWFWWRHGYQFCHNIYLVIWKYKTDNIKEQRISFKSSGTLKCFNSSLSFTNNVSNFLDFHKTI